MHSALRGRRSQQSTSCPTRRSGRSFQRSRAGRRFPRSSCGGELIGGADIVQELAETGELKQKLDSALGEGWQGGGEERVVSVSEGSSPLRLVP